MQTKHSLNWFIAHQGKTLYRNSICWPNIAYKIYFVGPKEIEYKKYEYEISKETLNRVKKFKLVKGEKVPIFKIAKRIQPSKKYCDKESLKHFLSQDQGYRFFKSMPENLQLSNIEL